MNSLHQKIIDISNPVIFYELLSPANHKKSSLDAYIDCSVDLLMSTPISIDAVNIPEVRDEDHNSTARTEIYIPKVDPGTFAKSLEEASYNHINVVINRGTVHASMEKQKKWLGTVLAHDINTLVLVGGSSSKIKYPGPSVLEMGHYIEKHYKEKIFCGGIAIQTRRCHEKEKDEPFRIYTKSLHGINFFTTQIIYDPISIKLFLRDYANVCAAYKSAPKRIVLSFAPVSTKKDLEFLRWLGVVIPKTMEQELFKADIGIGWRSIKIAAHILQDILFFMQEARIMVPLGINIEHITCHNFELSLQFINRLGKIYYDYMHVKSEG